MGIPATDLTNDEEEIIFEFEGDELVLPPITTKPIGNQCDKQCKKLKANIRKECNILRKRVALALKQRGCQTKIIAYKKRKTCKQS